MTTNHLNKSTLQFFMNLKNGDMIKKKKNKHKVILCFQDNISSWLVREGKKEKKSCTILCLLKLSKIL